MIPTNNQLKVDASLGKHSCNRTEESWRDIPGLEGRYQASTHGRLRWVGPAIGSTCPGRIVTGTKNQDGYYSVRPYERPDRRVVRVHQLVALAFLGPCPDGLEVNHIDGDRTNNAPCNLVYITHAENVRHSWALGNCDRRGEANGRAKLTANDVRRIRKLHASGRPRTELAEAYGITAGQVNRIAARQAWRHVE